MKAPRVRSASRLECGAVMFDMIDFRRSEMSLGTILLIVVVLLLIGAIPAWPHSRSWGYGPSGGIGLVVLILLILLLTGRL
jgi:hypothetical protein